MDHRIIVIPSYFLKAARLSKKHGLLLSELTENILASIHPKKRYLSCI